VHGLLAFVAYLIAGVADAGFWGVVTGFASVIPLVGTGLIWLPTSVYLLAQGHTWQGFFVIGWGLLIIGTSDNVIRFMLAKRMADVHPIVTVLGVIIGLRSFGITGLIFGPLIICYFLILLKIYYVEYQKPEVERQRNLLPSYLQFKQTVKRRS
jgi:predicted PurR-regulated permease PerM